MMITRHNYEEYFILYLDNELDSEVRRQVEIFVQQHPDLKEELELLHQFKLTPDTSITYANKKDLLKENGATAVNLSNYEEWFVLYIDHELTPAQKKMVAQFIADNPTLQPELKLLEHSKLEPEHFVFENKDLLYRHESKLRRMLPPMWRVAAAILIFAVGITATIILNNKPSGTQDTEMANLDDKNQKTNQTVLPEQKNNTPQTLSNNESRIEDLASGSQEKLAVTTELLQPSHFNKTSSNTITSKKQEPIIAAGAKETNNLPKPLNNRNVLTPSDNVIADINTPNEIITPKNVLTNAPVTSKTTQPSNIVAASFSNDNEADFDQTDEKKNKLRGIFRKITRTFEKRTNIDVTDEDDRLLVAGLSIKLK